MKNIVLFGGSNSVMKDYLYSGLLCNDNVNLFNLALGGCTCIQNLYELKREKNKTIIEKADLIISESNINDIWANYESHEKLSVNIVYRDLNWYYKELYDINKKILVLILPFSPENSKFKTINNIHRKLIKYYGFNMIDMQDYYKSYNLEEFGSRVDPAHQMSKIMRELGKNIADNMSCFKSIDNLGRINDNPKFAFCTPNDMKLNKNINMQKYLIRNSMYDEATYRLQNGICLQFPIRFKNWKLIALHTWNHDLDSLVKNPSSWIESMLYISQITLKNSQKSIVKQSSFLSSVQNIQNDFFIDENSLVSFGDSGELVEFFQNTHSWSNDKKELDHCDLISFFLASPEGNYHTEEINFETLANENIEISNEYNFNHLIPPVESYKEIIDEYCSIMDSRKLAPLQKQITENNEQIIILNNEKSNLQTQINQLQNTLNTLPIKKQQLEISNLEQDLINKKLQTKQLERQLGLLSNDAVVSHGSKITIIHPNSAQSRIQNQLSYKLGQAMIVNSKSILGYIRMPFVLSYIHDKHKQEQKIYQENIKKDPSLKLPPLESYPDYKEALKEKECFTYKLGEALIKANKTWYKGGYVKLIFEIRKLKREFRKKANHA